MRSPDRDSRIGRPACIYWRSSELKLDETMEGDALASAFRPNPPSNEAFIAIMEAEWVFGVQDEHLRLVVAGGTQVLPLVRTLDGVIVGPVRDADGPCDRCVLDTARLRGARWLLQRWDDEVLRRKATHADTQTIAGGPLVGALALGVIRSLVGGEPDARRRGSMWRIALPLAAVDRIVVNRSPGCACRRDGGRGDG